MAEVLVALVIKYCKDSRLRSGESEKEIEVLIELIFTFTKAGQFRNIPTTLVDCGGKTIFPNIVFNERQSRNTYEYCDP